MEAVPSNNVEHMAANVTGRAYKKAASLRYCDFIIIFHLPVSYGRLLELIVFKPAVSFPLIIEQPARCIVAFAAAVVPDSFISPSSSPCLLHLSVVYLAT